METKQGYTMHQKQKLKRKHIAFRKYENPRKKRRRNKPENVSSANLSTRCFQMELGIRGLRNEDDSRFIQKKKMVDI